MDEMTVDEFMDIVMEMRQEIREIKKRLRRVEQDSWGDLEDIDDDDQVSK